ncbi:MAG: DUF3179 domain-containing protein [Chloroflexi bacterium]|nr:DUF3179 domain-containing protein [Chloroflexota bacterium]
MLKRLAKWKAAYAALSVLALAVGCSAGQTSGGQDRDAVPPSPPPPHQSPQDLKGVRFSVAAWPRTNFRIHSVPLDEFFGGGPGKDDIPPLDKPTFEDVERADAWLDDREPVQLVSFNGDVRAYPQQVLIWHEVVNDVVGGEPVTVTY